MTEELVSSSKNFVAIFLEFLVQVRLLPTLSAVSEVLHQLEVFLVHLLHISLKNYILKALFFSDIVVVW